jgi:hypothetical protein
MVWAASGRLTIIRSKLATNAILGKGITPFRALETEPWVHPEAGL